ncbi:hypothetical protein [Microbacterium sp. SLBN-146]|uniref:hypothetical protein n=1 Tax=Microbacterium sp. SLBN-146 TaxID=2768457 RepID=UPI00115105F5|nr:hypothetical protein [Microbacterium sp. SLBN-146]TQJ30132.1 hypothetical protein FBY39_0577 [Microbacterium sp. SLBN-146]
MAETEGAASGVTGEPWETGVLGGAAVPAQAPAVPDPIRESDPAQAKVARSRWLDVGVLVAVLPVAMAALRIVLYSGGDPVLMRVLIETLDVPTLLLGTLLPLLPLLFWLALQPLITDAPLTRQLLRRTAPNRNWWLVLIIALPLLYVLVGPWPDTIETILWFGGALALGALTVWGVGVFRWRRAGHPWRTALRVRVTIASQPLGSVTHLLLVSVVLIVVIFAMPRGFWLPLESITADGADLTGYVLQSEDGWTTVMTEGRAIERFPAASVTSRTVCDQGEYESLITVLVGGTAPLSSPCP